MYIAGTCKVYRQGSILRREEKKNQHEVIEYSIEVIYWAPPFLFIFPFVESNRFMHSSTILFIPLYRRELTRNGTFDDVTSVIHNTMSLQLNKYYFWTIKDGSFVN